MLQSWPTELDEASFIAGEIKRVIACMGGSLQFLDFAILRLVTTNSSCKWGLMRFAQSGSTPCLA